MRWTARAIAFIATGVLGVTGVACGVGNSHKTSSGPTVASVCPAPFSKDGLLADTAEGAVVVVDPTSFHTSVVGTHVFANGGVSVRPQLDRAYVTALGTDGQPAIWVISVSGCRRDRSRIEADAELPSVSPDGSRLAFVSLDADGRQTGTAIVRLGATGMPMGAVRECRALSIPPPFPITGVAVGPHGSSLAVWGGFVDEYLGKAHPTVGTLDPSTTTSLASLAPVFDGEGLSNGPLPQNRKNQKPEDWQSAPSYIANGEFLVGGTDRDITMPFTNTTPGESGGGIRLIVSGVGPIQSLAPGPNGSLAWVGTNHLLTLATDAINLPFGPQAEVPTGIGVTSRVGQWHSITARRTGSDWGHHLGTRTGTMATCRWAKKAVSLLGPYAPAVEGL